MDLQNPHAGPTVPDSPEIPLLDLHSQFTGSPDHASLLLPPDLEPPSQSPEPPPKSPSTKPKEKESAILALLLIVIALLQLVLISYRSTTLVKFIDLELTAFRASQKGLVW